MYASNSDLGSCTPGLSVQGLALMNQFTSWQLPCAKDKTTCHFFLYFREPMKLSIFATPSMLRPSQHIILPSALAVVFGAVRFWRCAIPSPLVRRPLGQSRNNIANNGTFPHTETSKTSSDRRGSPISLCRVIAGEQNCASPSLPCQNSLKRQITFPPHARQHDGRAEWWNTHMPLAILAPLC
jgi:hypothetical protein